MPANEPDTSPLAPPVNRRRVLLALAWYSVATHRGITRYAHEAGWILDGGFVRTLDLPDRWAGDGVITVYDIQPRLDAMLDRLDVPKVHIGYGRPRPDVPTVCTDVALLGKLAADHLLSRGFRNLAYYQHQDSPGDCLHRDAFVQAIAAHGVKAHVLGPLKTHLAARGLGEQDLHPVLGGMLRALPKPVAVFAEYDDRAIAVMDAAVLMGLRVPEEVAVLGADNDELRCPFAPVPLSSMDNDEERIGYEAARLLDRRMRGEPAPTEPVHIPPRGVVVRQSTNLLAIPHTHVARALRLIWEHYAEPIDAAQIAKEIPLSYPQLHTTFVRHVGRSMADELERCRIEHAQKLLRETDLKLMEIALRSGFGSVDRLGRVFQRALGFTPGRYRKQHDLGRGEADAPVPAAMDPGL